MNIKNIEPFSIRRPDDRMLNPLWKFYIDLLNSIDDYQFDGTAEFYGLTNHGYFSYLHNSNNAKELEYLDEFVLNFSEDVILEYARLKYPPGTAFQSAHITFSVARCTVSISDTFKFTDTGYIQMSNGNSKNSHNFSEVIYCPHNTKWANIIEYEVDMSTYEGKLAYAKKHYPIGTKYMSLGSEGQAYRISEITSTPKYFGSFIEGGFAYIYANGKWAEIIKEETIMKTQKLTRQGLKEIHAVACPNWKDVLEKYGSRNPLEDYIELTQEEVDKMFRACTEDQLSIVSKHLKQDDGSVGLSFINNKNLLQESYDIIGIIGTGDYAHKSFWLTDRYNWEIKTDSAGRLCLIPTKKK